MKTILVILTALLLTACSISEPRLSFGKKCTVKDDKIVYSYLWIYDKSAGVPADAITCELLDK
jgi:hypothetical protein|tara:strand:- start:129 stop:317 length:189 start_codon:yes stop_codon:yes gene_type:complete